MIDELVVLYAPPWFGPTRFSKHHLATYFARRGTRVLYIEAPLTPLAARHGHAFLTELRRTLRAPRQVEKNLWVRRHFLPIPYHAATPLTSSRVANRLGQRLLAQNIRRDLQGLGLRTPVIVAGLPHAADCVRALPRRALVYHCADEYAHVSGFPATLPALEADLCRASDVVITTSQTLCEARRHLNPRTYWIPNGVDFPEFSRPAAPPAELQHVRGPIVGFVGGLSEWVDLRLVATLAHHRPDLSFLLIGPLSIDASSVRNFPNVQLLGPRPYDTLPSYLAAMDVALIPFTRSEVSYHADPIKVYEYLAAGVPVVATDLPALRRLAGVVMLAGSDAEFLQGIERALAEGREARRAERQAEAARHSWSDRFERLERILSETLACGS